jgi:hypothetical protein
MASQQQLKATASAPTSGPVYGLAQSEEQRRLQSQASAAGQAQQRAMAGQQDVMGMLQQQALGQGGPSVAQQQAAAQQQQAVINQMGQAAQGRGGNLAAQARSAQGMGAAGAMAAQQQAAQMRAQEMQQAQQAYAQQANVLGGQSQADALARAQMAQQVNQFVQGQGQQQAQFNQQAAAQQMQANREFGMGVAEMGLGAVQGAAMMSDERVKHIERRDAGADAVDAVAALDSLKYEYKGDEYGQRGKILGISAQQLEQVAPQLVVPTKKGKAVSMPGVSSLALAAVAELAREVKDMRNG